MSTTLPLIGQHLFSMVKDEVAAAGFLSDELLSALNAVFGPPLLQAFAILDMEGSVTHYTSPAGRTVYQVIMKALIKVC